MIYSEAGMYQILTVFYHIPDLPKLAIQIRFLELIIIIIMMMSGLVTLSP